MSRGEAILLHISNLLVGGTGLVYAWLLYALEPADPFSVVNHPWQPHLQHLHVLLAPLLVFAAGLIWRGHVWKGWRRKVRRRSGLSLVLTLVPMVVSGYLIQTATDDAWRQVWVIVHLTASALWVLGYLVHQLLPRRRPVSGRDGSPSLGGRDGRSPSLGRSAPPPALVPEGELRRDHA